MAVVDTSNSVVEIDIVYIVVKLQFLMIGVMEYSASAVPSKPYLPKLRNEFVDDTCLVVTVSHLVLPNGKSSVEDVE